MRLVVILSLALLAVTLLASCAAPGNTADGEPPLSEQESSAAFRLMSPKASPPSQIVRRGLTGTLGFDEIEGGCAFLESRDGIRYEVLYPEGWELRRSPLRLISPTGDVVAGPGDEITVQGSEATDMASICQIGPIFRATVVGTP